MASTLNQPSNCPINGVHLSIIGLIVMFVPHHAQSGEQVNTYGNESPAIGENKGNVTIEYNHSNNTYSGTTQKKYVLRNPRYGTVNVFSEPSVAAAINPSKSVCMAIAGTPITLLGNKAKEGVVEFRKVQIHTTEDSCSQKIGWVGLENISYE